MLTATATNLVPWMPSELVRDGVFADCAAQLKELPLAQHYEQLYDRRMSELLQKESRRRQGRQLEMEHRFTDHRVSRGYD